MKASTQSNIQIQKFHPTQNAKLVYVVCLINIPIVTSCRILVLLSIAIKNIPYSVLFSSCILFTTVELIHLRLFQARFFVIVRTSYVMLQLRFVLHRVNTDEMQNFISSLIRGPARGVSGVSIDTPRILETSTAEPQFQSVHQSKL